MTTQEMLDYFDLLQDKVNSDYFSEDEKLTFLNEAQIIFLNQHMEKEVEGALNFYERGHIDSRSLENTLGNTDILYPLVVSDMSSINGGGDLLQTSSGGFLSRENLETAITFNSGASTEPMKILSFGVDVSGATYPKRANFVRHNDLLPHLNNDFLVPTSSSPIWTNDNQGYQFYPKGELDIVASVVRYPESISVGQDCELQAATHDRIVSIAIEIAVVSSRDGGLAQLNAIKTT